MTEPRRIGDLLAETLAAIRARGPMLAMRSVERASPRGPWAGWRQT